jgi:hypothetical protein
VLAVVAGAVLVAAAVPLAAVVPLLALLAVAWNVADTDPH